jgi:hypothetical protein
MKSNLLFVLATLLTTVLGELVVEPSPSEGFSVNNLNNDRFFYTKNVNLSTVLNKQVKLPCYIQKGRKFIWMQADRNEILTIDNILITSDRRFSIETSPDCATNLINPNELIVRHRKSTNDDDNEKEEDETYLSIERNGCWIHLIIENVSLDDEGLYICQIDTMSSTKISMNVLGKI